MKVCFKIVRTDTWYPVADVPDGFTDEEALEYLHENTSWGDMFDEMCHKNTLDTTTDIDVWEVVG